MNKNYGISAPTGVRSEAELKRLQAMLRPRAATGVWSQEDQSAYDAYLKKEAADPLSYRVYGYEPPAMVSNRARVESMQDILGVKVDGLWGPETQAAYDARRQEEAALRTQQARGERGLVPLQGGVDDGYVSAVPDSPMIPNRVYAERDNAAALARQYRGTLGSTTLQGGIDDNYVSAVPEGPMIPNRVKAGDTPTLVEKVYQGLLGVARQKSGEAGRIAMMEKKTGDAPAPKAAASIDEINAKYDEKVAPLEARLKGITGTLFSRNRQLDPDTRGQLYQEEAALIRQINAWEQRRDADLYAFRVEQNHRSQYDGYTLAEVDAAIHSLSKQAGAIAGQLGRRDNIREHAQMYQDSIELVREKDALRTYRDGLIEETEHNRLSSFDYRGAAATAVKEPKFMTSDRYLTPAHRGKKDQWIDYWLEEYGDLIAECAGPGYDLLKPRAEELIEEIESGQYSAAEVKLFYEEYRSLPIILGDEMLRNPYVLVYADLISLRVVYNDSDKIMIRNAMAQLIKETAQVESPLQLGLIKTAYDILQAKLPYEAAKFAAADEFLWGLPSYMYTSAAQHSPTEFGAQYVYLTSPEAMKQANPAAYTGSGALAGAYRNASFIGSLLAAGGLTEKALKAIIKYYAESGLRDYMKN